jgi:hypothetical protein
LVGTHERAKRGKIPPEGNWRPGYGKRGFTNHQ